MFMSSLILVAIGCFGFMARRMLPLPLYKYYRQAFIQNIALTMDAILAV